MFRRSQTGPATPGAAEIVRGRPPRSRKDPVPVTNTTNPVGDENPGLIKMHDIAPLTSQYYPASAVSLSSPAAGPSQKLVRSKKPSFSLAVSGITTQAPDAERAARLERLRAEAEARLSRETDSTATLQEV